MKVKIGIAEPFKKHQFAITSLPFVIGSGNSCDWQVTDAGMLEKHCSFDARNQKVILQMFSGGGKKYAVVPGKDYALHVGNLFLIVRQFKKFTPAIGEKWTKRILDGTWWLGLAGTKREDGSADGPHTLSDIAQMVTQGMIR